jgi:hypothetical protein
MHKTHLPESDNLTKTPVPLHHLVDKLVISLLPGATVSGSFIINDICRQLRVNTDPQVLASVLGSVLYHSILFSGDDCLRISAKSFGLVTLVHIRNSHSENEKLIAESLSQIRPLAEKLGGCIQISNNRTKGTTIVFTFLNPAIAA